MPEGVPEKEFNKFFKGCYNKIPYRTRKKAEEFADFQLRKFGKKLVPYDCEYCRNYHLTTRKR